MRAMGRAMGAVVVLGVLWSCVGEDPDVVPTTSGSTSSGASTPGGGPSARQVQCNDKRCATGEVCCLTFGESSIQKAECSTEAACSSGALLCDGPSDCAEGQKCCAKTRGGSVQYGPSYCAATCDDGNREAQLCNESSECASGSCAPPQSSTTPTYLKECKPQ